MVRKGKEGLFIRAPYREQAGSLDVPGVCYISTSWVPLGRVGNHPPPSPEWLATDWRSASRFVARHWPLTAEPFLTACPPNRHSSATDFPDLSR